MLKELAVITSLTVSGLSLAAEQDQRSGPADNPLYQQLLWDFEDISKSDMPQKRKAEQLQSISEKMRKLQDTRNESYNSCMQESNKQQSNDYNRCDRNGGKESCYNRADKNAESRKNSCERVAHSDNATKVITGN